MASSCVTCGVPAPRARAGRTLCSRPPGPLPLTALPARALRPPPPLSLRAQADFFARAVAIAKAQKTAVEARGLKKVADFRASLHDSDTSAWPPALIALKADVTAFARRFPVIGFDAAAMRYKA